MEVLCGADAKRSPGTPVSRCAEVMCAKLRTRLVFTSLKTPPSRSPRWLAFSGGALSLYNYSGGAWGLSLYARQALLKIKLYPVCGLPPSPHPRRSAVARRTDLEGFFKIYFVTRFLPIFHFFPPSLY